MTCQLRFERSWLGRHKQGRSSSTPVTSDLAKTFRQKCLWLHQLVKNQKSTEGSVIYVLGNPQRDVSDWLPLINKPDTIATYRIPTATCRQQLTTPNNACLCVRACRPEVPSYRTKKCASTTAQRAQLRERERERETEREKEKGRKVDVKNKGQTH